MACSWRDDLRVESWTRRSASLRSVFSGSLSSKLRPRVPVVLPWCRAAAATQSFPVYFSLTIRDRALDGKPRPQFPRQPFRFRRRTRTAALRLHPSIHAIAAVGSRVAGSSVAKSAGHSPLEKLRDRPGPPHNQVHCRYSCVRRRAPGHPPPNRRIARRFLRS